jgi:hypothetical protein
MRRAADQLASWLYAVVDLAVIMAPSLVLAGSAYQSGVSGTPGVDLLVTSGVVGVAHAVVAGARLRSEMRLAVRRLDPLIAALDALVVLAVCVTLLMVVVLEGFAGEHAVLVNEGWPVVALWVGVLLLAVALAELTGRLIFRWLEGAPQRRVVSGRAGPLVRRNEA